MPWMVPSHPAPALLLKAWKPAWFSGLGLVLGTMAPDLAFILRLDNDAVASHTFLGQVYVTIPLVLLLHWMATTIVFPWLLPLVRGGPPLHLHELAAVRTAASAMDWGRIAVSGLVGGITHVLLDGVTHGNHSGWAVPFIPLLRMPVPVPGGAAPLHDLLQAALSLLLGGVALVTWNRLGRERRLWAWSAQKSQAVVMAPSASRRREARWLLGCFVIGALVAPALRPGAPSGLLLELAAYGAIAFVAYGVVIGALTARSQSSMSSSSSSSSSS